MNPPVATSPEKKVCLVTFGCQMNKLDSELILGRFTESGYLTTESEEEASVVLFNTCSVRGHAEDRVYSRVGALKKLKQRRPELVIGVTGCMAQREGEDAFENSALIDIVCGTREFGRLPELVDEVREGRRQILATAEEPEVQIERNLAVRPQKHHAYVVVMRGCDMSCSFCIVPTVRGPVASRPVEEIAREVERLVADGVREITLLGQTIDAYGYDLEGKVRLSTLLYRLAEVTDLRRIGLITLHAAYVGKDFIEAMGAIPQMNTFLPLPAQSGSDPVLKAMNRGYTLGRYRDKIAALRETVPGIEFSSDWIVGFPGESDADFEKSVDFLREIGFLQSYVFKYSPRPETPAFAVEDTVPAEVKTQRNIRLLEVQDEVSLTRNSLQVGTTHEVLLDIPHPKFPGTWKGRTRSQHLVQVRGEGLAPGQFLNVRVESATPHLLCGVPA